MAPATSRKRSPVKREHVVATDFSDDMLYVAQTELAGFDNVEFKNENWQNTSFADESFDTIFSGFVIPCVDDKVQVLKESQRILKPSGHVIVANPNLPLLGGFRMFQFLCRNIVAWRGKLPPVSFRSVSELLDETSFTLVSLDVIKDPTNPSSAPVEYVRLLNHNCACFLGNWNSSPRCKCFRKTRRDRQDGYNDAPVFVRYISRFN